MYMNLVTGFIKSDFSTKSKARRAWAVRRSVLAIAAVFDRTLLGSLHAPLLKRLHKASLRLQLILTSTTLTHWTRNLNSLCSCVSKLYMIRAICWKLDIYCLNRKNTPFIIFSMLIAVGNGMLHDIFVILVFTRLIRYWNGPFWQETRGGSKETRDKVFLTIESYFMHQYLSFDTKFSFLCS